jgi:hypothetical protein
MGSVQEWIPEPVACTGRSDVAGGPERGRWYLDRSKWRNPYTLISALSCLRPIWTVITDSLGYLCMTLHCRSVGPDFGRTKYISDCNEFWDFATMKISSNNVCCFFFFFFIGCMFLDVEFVKTSAMCFLIKCKALYLEADVVSQMFPMIHSYQTKDEEFMSS